MTTPSEMQSAPDYEVVLDEPDAATGMHYLAVGDLEAGHDELLLRTMQAVTGRERYDVAYTDPPWNAGIGRMFRKWAGPADDPGRYDRPVDVDAILRLTARLCAEQVAGWSFVQIGKQKIDVLRTAMHRAYGHPPLAIDCEHVNDGGTRKEGDAWLLAAHPDESVMLEQPPVVRPGLAWMDLCEEVLAQVTQLDQTVVDWYMGQGMVLRVADQLGLWSYGLEINRKRALEAVDRLESDRDRRRVSSQR